MRSEKISTLYLKNPNGSREASQVLISQILQYFHIFSLWEISMNAYLYFHLLMLLRCQKPPTHLSGTHISMTSVQFQINNNSTTGGQTRHASLIVTRSNSPTHTLKLVCVCVCVRNMSRCVPIKVNVKERINTRIISELINYLESPSFI